jgi:hypothetical protein
MRYCAKSRAIAVALAIVSVSYACGQKPAGSATPGSSAQWMLSYQGQGDADVRKDPQFAPLLRSTLPQRQFFESKMTLAAAIQYYLGVGTGRVTVADGRYATVTGCVPHMCDESQGLLWVDTKSAGPNVLFAALDPISGTESEGSTTTYHLWIFGSQLLHADTDHVDALPDDFLKQLHSLVGGRPVSSAVFVEPSNIMVPLLPKQSLHLSVVSSVRNNGIVEG